MLHLFLFSHKTIVTILTIVATFFAILLLLGIRKSYKLKKENERLEEMNRKIAEKEAEANKYRDFTDGHMYQ